MDQITVMDFLEYKLQNVQIELNDLNKFISINKNKINNEIKVNNYKVSDEKQLLKSGSNNPDCKESGNNKNKEYEKFEKNIENNVDIKTKSLEIDNKLEKQFIQKDFNSNNKKESRKLWSDIVEEDEKKNNNEPEILLRKYDDLKKEFDKLDFNFKNLLKYVNKDGVSKIIKFIFYDCIVTWKLEERHIKDDMIKIMLNPINKNTTIFLIFYYHVKKHTLGILETNGIKWYKIDFKERLMEYYDSNGQTKHLYYHFVNIENEINI